jgi:thiol-disulfide isomerase/thioredoxin
MALARRDALILGGVAVAAAAAGLLVAPRLLEPRAGDAGALRQASFADLAGKTRTIAEWRGRPLLVNFWATWCAPCREEIPILMVARQKFSSTGLEIVGIAIDNAQKVAEFSLSFKISYPILVADAGGLELMRQLGNSGGGLPYTVFLDRRGDITRRKLGALKQPELDQALGRITD